MREREGKKIPTKSSSSSFLAREIIAIIIIIIKILKKERPPSPFNLLTGAKHCAEGYARQNQSMVAMATAGAPEVSVYVSCPSDEGRRYSPSHRQHLMYRTSSTPRDEISHVWLVVNGLPNDRQTKKNDNPKRRWQNQTKWFTCRLRSSVMRDI